MMDYILRILAAGVGRRIATLMIAMNRNVESKILRQAMVVPKSKHMGIVT